MWEWLEGLAQHPVIAALSVIGGALGLITLFISFMRGTIKIPVKAWVFLHGKPYERKEVNAFEIIHEWDKLLPRLYGEAPSGTLGDLDMPYTRRNPKKDLQTELREKLNAHKKILLLAPSGYGKTREAGKLVESMIARGYRAILVHSKGWLDVPQHWPDGLPNNQIVIVLDDLNRLIPSSPTVQMERETCDPAVRLPSYEQRLVRFVRYFEDGASNVCVIATARDKQELLARTKDSLWGEFEEVNLEQFTPDAMCELLEAAAGKAGVEAKPEIVKRCIQKSEHNPRVIKNNLQRCKQEGKQLDDKDYEPTLDGSWNARYQSLIKRYPAVHCIYNAIYLLQSAGVVLEIERVKAVALMLVQGRLQRIWMRLPIQRALRFLQQSGEINLTTYNNQKVFVPADGQIIPSSADLTCKCKSASGTNTANGYPSSEKILELYDRLVHLFRRRGDLQALKELGLVALAKLRRTDEALAAFDRALAIDPQDAEAHNYRGLALAQLGRTDEALTVFDCALAIDPQDARIHYSRGVVLAKLGRMHEALAAFDEALKINPQFANVHYQRGVVLAQLGRMDEALAAFDRSLAIDPQDAEAHNYRGVALTELGRTDEALAAFDRALAIDPQDAGIHYSRGLALTQLGRMHEALAAFDEALKINPQFA
jgi:tetratricopeptide (TPR) repeat protein